MAADPLDATKARLAEVAEALDAHRSDSSDLLEERRVLVVELRAAGVGRPELAELAKCSTDLVKSMTRKPASRQKAGKAKAG